ncbi:MAG: bifunctional alpha,alpha-trehalose-phosphate synthase (UDP-forming)/trehalose-phosphatase [Myxococcota bacterium]
MSSLPRLAQTASAAVIAASAAVIERASRLIVLSNRLPLTVRKEGGRARIDRSSGGLVAALDPALRRRGGTWLGWAGGALPKGVASITDPYRLVSLPLSRNEVRGYYHGFANRTLWPLFHSFPTRMELDPEDWAAYEAVNRRFAQLAACSAGREDLIWIHDYHLMRVAPALRRLLPGARIAFFLHIPFPAFDLFRILPWDREILRGLLACDLVGFHCARYASNFLDCAEHLLGARVDREHGHVEHGQHTATVGAFPLGIDYELFARRAREAPRTPQCAERIVLGVDRLDYTKGLPEKIRAFERLLDTHPEHRERIVLIQIAEPSRGAVAEYQRLKREVDELVGRVNGRFGTSSWTPVRYLHRHFDPEALAQLYRDAEVALVTPLRDGMNLVAKEFVACQVDEPGVLILSRLAGAAESMHEAIRVNPYHHDAVAEALHQALVMDPPERMARMRALQRRERRSDVYAWLDETLRIAGSPPARFRPVLSADFTAWLGRHLAGTRLALFIDYDGTLAPIVRRPGEAQVSDGVREALLACLKRDDTEVTIVSARTLADLRARLALPGLGFAGNHGLEIECPELPPFIHPDVAHFVERAGALSHALAALRDPGVWVEEKGASLTLHYREADPAAHARIAARAHEIVTGFGFQALDAPCAIEARAPSGWDKGRAVLHVLRARYGPEWPEKLSVVYVGDAETDEDAFRALQGLGFTFRVGSAERPTSATRRLPDVEAVETLLRWAAERPSLR